MNGLKSFGAICRLEQELDSDRNWVNKIGILANGLAKGDDIAIGERGGDFGSEGYWGGVADFE